MAVDVIIDPSSGQIYWNDQAGSGTQTIAISGNATNAINVVGYSNFFSAGGGGLGTQILATFTDSPTSTFTPGTNAYDLGSTSLRWNFYGTGGNFTGVISTSSSTASTSSTTGALTVSGGVGIGGSLHVGTSRNTLYTVTPIAGFAASIPSTASVEILNSNSLGYTRLNLTNNNGNYASFSLNGSGVANPNRAAIESSASLLIAAETSILHISTSGDHIFDSGGYCLRIGGSGVSVLLTGPSTSSSTGALTVVGGAGIAKTSYFGQSVFIQGTTASGSTSTGALVVTGGVGIGGSLNVFGTIDVADNIEVLSQKEVRFFNSANTFYTGLRAGSSSANVTFTLPIADGTANQVLYTNGSAGLAWTTVASVSAITTLNGLTAATQTFATGTSGTDFNISSATSTHTFNIPYAGAASTGLITTQAQTIAGAKTFSGNTAITASTASTNPINGALVVTGGVGISGRLNVGRAITSTASGILAGFCGTVSGVASVFIQNTSSSFMASAALAFANDVDTAYISLYNSNSDVSSQELSINNGAGPIKLTSGSGQTISFLPGGGAGVRISSTGTSVERNTAATSATAGALTVVGGAGIAKTSYFGQDVFIQGATASTSTTTGALNVAGGLGVVGDVYVASATNARLNIMGSSGDEGGEIFLNKAVTNTTLTTGVSIDVNQNRLRFFETGGSNRGAYIDLTSCSTSAGTNLLVGSGASGLTSLNGLTSSSQTFATGTSGTDFNISSTTSTHTFNIPYAGSGATGLVTTQTQTIAGAKTFSGQTSVTNSTASTSTTTGALIITGGVGIAGSIWSGQHIVTDTTVSSTTSTGALLVFGGLGVSGQINAVSLQTSGNALISGNLTFNGVGVFGNATSDTINSLARYISDILPSADNSYDLGNNSLGWRNFRISGVGTIATLQVTSVTSGVWAGTAISAVNGGTGQNTYAIGDILYASSSTALTRLAAGTAGSVLASGGAGAAPSWVLASSGSGGAGTVATPTASNLVAYYPGTGASVASYNRVSIDTANSSVEISSQNSKSGLILNALNGSISNLAEFKNSFGDVLWSIGATAQALRGFGSSLWLDSASTLLLTAPAALTFYNTAETFSTSLTGATNATTDLTFILPTAAGTAGSVLTTAGASGQLYWSAPGSAGGGSGTVTSGTAGSIAYYTGTGTTVGGSPGFTYTTSGTASTMNVFGGGGAIGTTIFTVQAYSSTSVRVGIGTNLPQYELEIVGELSATNKSFVIDHPTKPGKKLRYGSLEGPENGVYVRGELKDSNIIETPDHWTGLVYPDSFTVTLTPIGRFSHLYVEKIEDYKVFIADAYMNPIHCYYTVWAERKDIPKLVTEY
jgi:hypothetical protein